MLIDKPIFVSNFITLPREGGDASTYEYFSEMVAERLEFCIAYGASFAQLLGKNERVRLGHRALTL